MQEQPQSVSFSWGSRSPAQRPTKREKLPETNKYSMLTLSAKMMWVHTDTTSEEGSCSQLQYWWTGGSITGGVVWLRGLSRRLTCRGYHPHCSSPGSIPLVALCCMASPLSKMDDYKFIKQYLFNCYRWWICCLLLVRLIVFVCYCFHFLIHKVKNHNINHNDLLLVWLFSLYIFCVLPPAASTITVWGCSSLYTSVLYWVWRDINTATISTKR